MTILQFTRMKKDISGAKLARTVGIPPAYVSMIERRRMIPTRDELSKFAAVLNVPADMLLAEVKLAPELEEAIA